MLRKEPQLTHDRNLLLGQLFCAITIGIILIECLLTLFLSRENPAIQLSVFSINFLSSLFYIFVFFILRYYLLNFRMDKIRIALMTTIVLLIIQFLFSKGSTVLSVFIYRHFDSETLMMLTANTKSIIHFIILLAYFVTGVMLIANKSDFVGGLRIVGAAFILKVLCSVAGAFGRNVLIDRYISMQHTEAPDGMIVGNMIEYIFNISNILAFIPDIIILVILIFLFTRAKQHTIQWQDPMA